jgi:chorismate mutase
LAALRAELDEIDTGLHDLLMRRADVVARVAQTGAKGVMPLRAGREADIIRRLLARHRGPLPRGAIVRIWRELLASTTAMQGAFSVAVCDAAPGGAYARLAREHFGGLTPMRVHGSPMQAISEVSSGTASVAVLPVPLDDEAPSAAWWTALLHRDDPRISVVAKLPFWSASGRGGAQPTGFVVAAVPPDPSGLDRSLIGLELPRGMSRARLADLVEKAGIVQTRLLVRRDQEVAEALVLMEAEGMFADDDPRLTRLSELPRPPVAIGAFAVPVVDGDEP